MVVLNGTSTSGLARTVADAASQKGWVIKSVGNLSGPAPKITTVYYPQGAKSHALKLATQFRASTLPALAGMANDALTLVVVK